MSAHTPRPTQAAAISQKEWNAHIALIQAAVERFKVWPTVSAQNLIAYEVAACLSSIDKAKEAT